MIVRLQEDGKTVEERKEYKATGALLEENVLLRLYHLDNCETLTLETIEIDMTIDEAKALAKKLYAILEMEYRKPYTTN